MTKPQPGQATTAAKTTPGGGGGGGGGRGRSGGRPRHKSRYGTQLEEKQNLKRVYGIREEQLKKYYVQAQRSAGETGPSLVSLLERRLDNAIYRAGFAATRAQARQMASHRLFVVNGRVVNIPSRHLNVGDTVHVKETKRGKSHFTNFEKRIQNVQLPAWLELDGKNYGFRVTGVPTIEEARIGVDIQAIVEMLAR